MSERIRRLILNRLDELEKEYMRQDQLMEPDQEILKDISNMYEKWEARLSEFFE